MLRCSPPRTRQPHPYHERRPLQPFFGDFVRLFDASSCLRPVGCRQSHDAVYLLSFITARAPCRVKLDDRPDRRRDRPGGGVVATGARTPSKLILFSLQLLTTVIKANCRMTKSTPTPTVSDTKSANGTKRVQDTEVNDMYDVSTTYT